MALRREKVMERLLDLRERHGLSQEHAAQKVGITHRQWQRWEQGESMPYPRNLDAVASAFGISITDFFDPAEPVLDSDPAQLDRIEQKLDAILSRLPELGLAEVLEAEAARLAEQRAQIAAGSKRKTPTGKAS